MDIESFLLLQLSCSCCFFDFLVLLLVCGPCTDARVNLPFVYIAVCTIYQIKRVPNSNVDQSITEIDTTR